MNRWQDSVSQLRSAGTPAILISVDSIVGSTPREAGAQMVVSADQIFGTIGGGNLEFQACAIAREQLTLGSGEALRRFPLGAGLGQCCGGLVNLMFEPLNNEASWQKAMQSSESAVLYLFGAGHVGKALVSALQDLPIEIRWIDTRDNMMPQDSGAVAQMLITDSPEAEVDAAPAGSFFLVMTHDHGLDQRLCEQIFKRDDFAYFGLIGSQSKRRNFETRMARRGVDPGKFERMTCPIGIDGIRSKLPAMIAISVAAQILRVYDQRQNKKAGNHAMLKIVEGVG
ncbi:MAG: xanthine dehydrogenase accessory factor [Planctomycetota bacterium]|jgi:xanthine dehydrogenase accessory factor